MKIINNKIIRENINELIFSNINEKQIDFLSIDIDGNDYWVLDKINTDKINIICSEYNPWIGNNTQKVMPYDKNFTYKNDYYFGASLHSYVNLLKSKNFDLVAMESSGINAFYVKKKFSKYFEILSAQIVLRRPQNYILMRKFQ